MTPQGCLGKQNKYYIRLMSSWPNPGAGCLPFRLVHEVGCSGCYILQIRPNIPLSGMFGLRPRFFLLISVLLKSYSTSSFSIRLTSYLSNHPRSAYCWPGTISSRKGGSANISPSVCTIPGVTSYENPTRTAHKLQHPTSNTMCSTQFAFLA